MNKKIINLLASTTCSADEMTHHLRLAGDGDMGAGIRNLWLNGYSVGSFATAAIIGSGFLIYWAASQKRRFLKKLEATGAAFSKGIEYAQRQERERTLSSDISAEDFEE